MTRRKLLPQKTHRAQSSCSVFSAARSASFAVKPATARRGISLIEVLISMFVLLFGLMGVAAIFPVGNHYVVEGEKFDLGAALAQNAFEELKARGMLRPEAWIYADDPLGNEELDPTVPDPDYDPRYPLVIQDSNGPNPGFFNIDIANNDHGPGHAFVIDPLGASNTSEIRFPYQAQEIHSTQTNLWFQYVPPLGFTDPQEKLSGRTWPIRRVTLPFPDPTGTYSFSPMSGPVAETIFRLRDDLAVEQPDKSDVPSQQRWDTFDTNGTPDDQSDDVLLRRQYKGDYSWLATIVPGNAKALDALQPAHDAYGQISCDVSVVVFRKRDETPSSISERFTVGELLPGGGLALFSISPDTSQHKAIVDAVVEDVRSGNWIALAGTNPVTGDFLLKWYRILSIDDETSDIDIVTTGDVRKGRRAMLKGPDWPASEAQKAAGVVNAIAVITLPDVISVVTKPLRMESSSLWDLE